MASYTKHDLEFILKQIKIAEADVAGGTAINQADLIGSPLLPYGLRTLTGAQNNLVPGQNNFGSAANTFPRLLNPVFTSAENSPAAFGPPKPTSYAQTSGLVFDSQPRTISNLIADQTFSNPAAIAAALKRAGSADPAGDALTIANAFAIAKTTAAALITAQATASAASAALTAAQSGASDPLLASALTTAQGNNQTAQNNKNDAQTLLNTAVNNSDAAFAELTTAQNAANAASKALPIANAALSAANLLKDSTASTAGIDAAASAAALAASNSAGNAATAANDAEVAAFNAYNLTVSTFAANSPQALAKLAAYNSAVDAADIATAAASAALANFGLAAATAAASAQTATTTAAAKASALTARDAAVGFNATAQASKVTEVGQFTAAQDAVNIAGGVLSDALAASAQNLGDTALQALVVSAQLDYYEKVITKNTEQGHADAATAEATITANNLDSANTALITATTNATLATGQAATDVGLRNLALTTFGNATIAATQADAAKASALTAYNAAVATFAANSPQAISAFAALNNAISLSDDATDAASAAATAAITAATKASGSDQAATDALNKQVLAQKNADEALTLKNFTAATLFIEEGQHAAVVALEVAAQSTLDGLTTTADGTASALATAEANAAAANGDLGTAIAAAKAADAALLSAQNLANSTAADAAAIPGTLGLEVSNNGTIFIPNQAPDEGLSAQYNSWFTLFGQFFDHGLDSLAKGGSGTVFIPLKADDPLFVEGSNSNFMVLTRATNKPGADGLLGTADDVREHTNTTSPFVDQNQTYSSHPSHQVFLRAYELVNGKPKDTGELIENRSLGADGKYGTADDTPLGGMATWAVVKAQARDILGINLNDADVNGGPLIATDEYGNFLPGANGLPQVVNGNVLVEGVIGAPVSTLNATKGGYTFLDDIAHNAAPRTSRGVLLTADADNVAGGPVVRGQYDNELLDAHYIAGDGRVNENIGLTAVHAVFHSEHNRLVQHTKDIVLASNDLAFINEWLNTDLIALPTPTEIASLHWDGQRLFQAAKFGTEMQYQHLVFEEFARKIQIQVDVFAGYDSTINPAIVAEFAHVVYRFGHSMLTDTVDRFDTSFGLVNGSEQVGLIEAFLNPIEFANSGINSATATGAIVRGMTRQVANELDEFVNEAVRSNLVGLPLDLAALNIARGRETGVPTLNAARREFFAGTSDAQLRPYESWVDFAVNTKHAESAINFIAAYGTHAQLKMADVDTMVEKRDVAMALVLGGSATINKGSATEERTFTANDADRLDFLNSRGSYASLANGVTTTGVDAIDFWMGGLAERQMPFGGLLGSTFNFVFETQMEKLQDGDRLYYLARVAGLNFLTELEGNSFASLIMRNSDVTRLPGDVFSVPNFILEVDQSKQFTGLGVNGKDDPTGGSIFSSLVVRNNPSTPEIDTNYLKFTGGEHVVLGGTAGNDTLISSIGDDTIWGDAGDDRIEGGDGVDLLNGGDGNDIITDLGGDDNIKGGEGDDVISGGNGFDLILAGGGSDFIVAGEDPKEVFANQGNDFILGSSTFDTFFGNQGDDWIDGGGSADLLQGDMGDPFQASTVIGNDVIIGGGGNDDYDSESGDDIMVMGAGTQRAEGMLGYDWVTHKNQGVGANADLAFTGLLPPDVANLNDRFDNVEGVSGWDKNDVLRGDSFGSVALLAQAVAGNVQTNHALNNAQQIALIDGLQTFLDSMLGTGQTGFAGGNIILGGAGNDIMEGRGGNDLIDGDAWLNVRIKVTGHPTITSAENMAEIAPLLFSGVIKPSQLSIVREILNTNIATDVDTAVYNGNRSDYSILDNGDGTYEITHENIVARNGAPISDDGTDTIRNIQLLQFADGVFDLREVAPVIISNGGGNTAAVTIDENSLTVTTVIATDANAGQVMTYAINGGADAALFGIDAITGALNFVNAPNFEAPTDAGADNTYNVVVQASDGNLIDAQAIAVTVRDILEAPIITSNGGGATAAFTVAENTLLATNVIATNANSGTAITYSKSGIDAERFAINATTGALTFITAPNFEAPTDSGNNNTYQVTVMAQDGALSDTQTLSITIGNVNEAATGGVRITAYTATALAATLTATNDLSDPDGMTAFVPFQWQRQVAGVWSNIAGATSATLANQNDSTIRISSTYNDPFGANTVTSAETVFITANSGNNVRTGTAGNDFMLGLGGADVLTGAAGNDVVDGGIGGDRLVATVNDGNDTYIGGAGIDTYDLTLTPADATVNLSLGTSTSANTGVDTLSGIENVLGGAGNDVITDSAGINNIDGRG